MLTADFEEGKPYHGAELPNKWGGAVGLPANMTLCWVIPPITGSLAWFITGCYIGYAFAREEEIKSWLRSKKVGLIRKFNPTWEGLNEGWGK